MSDMLTTAEAAALLNERGVTTAYSKPYTAKTIQQYCVRGLFAGAYREGNDRRGYWQIPRESVEQFAPRRGRPPAANTTHDQGGSDDATNAHDDRV